MKKPVILIPFIMLVICGCGGTAENAANPDLDQILTSPTTELDVSDGVHLPQIFNGTFQLVEIETHSESGELLGEETIDPAATITVAAYYAEPADTFTARSNLITDETIEVSGAISLDVAANRLIVNIESSNTPSIVEGETYCLDLGQSTTSGFGISIEGSIKGQVVNQVYIFDKIE